MKLYTRWAKPYLKVAEQLRMKEFEGADLINAFNTVVLQLTLFGKKKIDVKYREPKDKDDLELSTLALNIQNAQMPLKPSQLVKSATTKERIRVENVEL